MTLTVKRLAIVVVISAIVVTACVDVHISPQPFMSGVSISTPGFVKYFPLTVRSDPGKKGLGGVYDSAVLFNTSWFYDWGPCPWTPSEGSWGMVQPEAVPMIWGDWGIGEVPLICKGTWLMEFNEPDGVDQANIRVARCPYLINAIEQTYPDRKKVAPGTSQINPLWIVQCREAFIAEYHRPPDWDALAVHGYVGKADSMINITKKYVELAKMWGIPEVWVTEWAIPVCLNGSLASSLIEAQKVVDYFESEPMITRYAWSIDYQSPDAWWYPSKACDTSLLTGRSDTNSLTEYGKWFAKVVQ